MIFKTVPSCPKDIDTVVSFMQYDDIPDFADISLQHAYDLALKGDALNLSAGNVKSFRIRYDEKFIHLILVAIDFTSENEFEDFRKATLKLGSKLNELNAEKIYVEGIDSFERSISIASQFSSALPLCDYTFDKYKENKSGYIDKEIFVFSPENILHAMNSSLQEGQNIAKGICIARDLTNEPSDVLTPSELANRTVSYGKNYGFDVEIFDKDACEDMNMCAFLTVARGSAYEPKLIVMRYQNDPSSSISKGVIGKGLCYDSGGLYLKPGSSMEHSKADMAGGAAVIGAMCAIAMNQLPVNVTCVVAACENMLDGNGYRNGDIIHTMAGKSVFVGSTDAEGRLTLADAITYMIHHENVDSIIELSTLTGSCANFFSDVCCGVLTTDDSLYSKLLSGSDICGEKYWRLPHFDEFREFIKSDIADLHNTSTSGAGGICAGLFLDSFKEETPFLHLDVAGMTFSKTKRDGFPKGGTGYGVKTVYHYIKE